MFKRLGRGAVMIAAVSLVLAVAFAFPVEAHAATYYVDWWDFDVRDQTVEFDLDRSKVATACPIDTVGWSIAVSYDWDFDDAVWANWVHADDDGTSDFDKTFVSPASNLEGFALPLDPAYVVYNVFCRVVSGGDTWRTQEFIVVNNRAEVVLANDEPTPVRLQEIGLASEASTLAPDVLPVSLDPSETVPVSLNASVSVASDTTLPVQVVGYGAGDPLDARSLIYLSMFSVGIGVGWVLYSWQR